MGCSGHDFFPSTHLSGHQLVPQVLSRDRNCSKDPAGNGTVIVHLAGRGGCSGQLRFISQSLSPSLFPVPSALPTVHFNLQIVRKEFNLTWKVSFNTTLLMGTVNSTFFLPLKKWRPTFSDFFQFGTLAVQNPHQKYLDSQCRVRLLPTWTLQANTTASKYMACI